MSLQHRRHVRPSLFKGGMSWEVSIPSNVNTYSSYGKLVPSFTDGLKLLQWWYAMRAEGLDDEEIWYTLTGQLTVDYSDLSK